MRIQSLILSTVVSVLFVAMGTIAGLAAYLSRSANEGSEARAVPVAVAAKPIDRACRDCGVVVAVKQVELKGRTAKAASQYEVRVRMSDGSTRTVTYSSAPAWKAGDRVRLQNGRVVG
jgi:hypothetical protein